MVPAATVTRAGTLALVGSLLESVTAMPPYGAAPLRRTVPVEVEPPYPVDGMRVRADSANGFIVSVAALLAPS